MLHIEERTKWLRAEIKSVLHITSNNRLYWFDQLCQTRRLTLTSLHLLFFVFFYFCRAAWCCWRSRWLFSLKSYWVSYTAGVVRLAERSLNVKITTCLLGVSAAKNVHLHCNARGVNSPHLYCLATVSAPSQDLISTTSYPAVWSPTCLNHINYSLNNQNNILCYRRFDFTSEVFIRTDFRWRSSVCKNLSHTWLSWDTYGTNSYILTTATGSHSWWKLPTWSRNVDNKVCYFGCLESN